MIKTNRLICNPRRPLGNRPTPTISSYSVNLHTVSSKPHDAIYQESDNSMYDYCSVDTPKLFFPANGVGCYDIKSIDHDTERREEKDSRYSGAGNKTWFEFHQKQHSRCTLTLGSGSPPWSTPCSHSKIHYPKGVSEPLLPAPSICKRVVADIAWPSPPLATLATGYATLGKI